MGRRKIPSSAYQLGNVQGCRGNCGTTLGYGFTLWAYSEVELSEGSWTAEEAAQCNHKPVSTEVKKVATSGFPAEGGGDGP